MDKPQRRMLLTLNLGADDSRSLIGVMRSILFDLERYYDNNKTDLPYHGISGGYDCGYSIDITVNESVNHDTYMEVLNEYLRETALPVSEQESE